MIVLLTLLGCPFGTVTGCDGWTLEPLDTLTAEASGPVPSVAFDVFAANPGPDFNHLYMDYSIANTSTDDCAVAIYVSDVIPDQELVPEIDAATTPPPDTIPGVGALLMRANLPASVPANRVDNTTVSLPDGDGQFLTVIGCAEGSIRVEMTFYAEFCEAPGEDVEGVVTPEAFEVRQLW